MGNELLEKPKEIGKLSTLGVADLLPNPDNRQARDEDIKPLAQSIKEVGLLHPLIVRPHPEEEGKYRIIAGERRWRALKRLGVESAPCYVAGRKDEDSSEAEILGVVENHHRRAPTPMEEAHAVRTLLEQGLETEAIAKSLGRSRSWVARRSSLTDLSQAWLAELANPHSKVGLWPPSHLELIARFPVEVQDRILKECVRVWRFNEMPTYGELANLTGSYLHLVAAAPWADDDDTLVPEAGSCAQCPKRASCAPDLFQEELLENGKTEKNDRCLDAACWEKKASAFLRRKLEEAKAEHPNLVAMDNGGEEEMDTDVGIEPNGLPVIHRAQVTICKKSDKKAVPALIVSGPGLGRIKWIERPKTEAVHTGNGNGAGANGHESPASPGEKSLDEKREVYDRRRRQVVIEAVHQKLEALIKIEAMEKAANVEGGRPLVERGMAVKTLLLLHLLLTGQGWRDLASFERPEMPKKLDWKTLSSLRPESLGSGEVRKETLKFCWELERLCLDTFRKRLRIEANGRNLDQYLEAEFVCGLLGFDLPALRVQAAQAVPYAKAWKEQIPDEWQGNPAESAGATAA